VGFETADDAGVYLLSADRAVVVTADFITPIVDVPEDFGAVAAANSLSDVYAMGGRPLVAVNLCGFPHTELPATVLRAILEGAAAKCAEAGVAVAGGHTVRDSEVKFGLSVTGEVHPDRIVRNSTARPGDRLILTKPLGTSALATAHKKGLLPVGSPGYRALVASMTELNRAGLVMHAHGATAATDVTGFGLTGHALEMARGAGLTLTIDTARLPLFPDALTLIAAGHTCGGTQANASFTASGVNYTETVTTVMRNLLNDPQTSGGLLVAVSAARATEMADALLGAGASCAVEIGEAGERGVGRPWLAFQ
jgi:selenide,water dikinase